MVKHIILWRWKDALKEEEKTQAGLRIKHGLEDLAGKIEGLEEIHVILNTMTSSNYDIMLECTFSDAEALAYYTAHPLHVAVKDQIIVPVTKDRACFDYEY